ncbi:hypothetical protein ACN27F_15520 [Solwaraspora sp. WMMB335]|uniref:hypothetical protein n=1 Tax=Solwaraspora sp. WMMB335 TaxID=3404118 RepID=UPI003B92D04A
MSAPEAEEEPRRTVPLKWLSWGGLALAPLAAVLLLLGDGDGSMRLAMVIAIASVVLIGLSITLRGGMETMRADMEDVLVEEMDVLREDVRNDISTAVRATHRAFGEKMQSVQDNFEALRGQVDAVRGEVVRSETARAEAVRPEAARAEAFARDVPDWGRDRAEYDRPDHDRPDRDPFDPVAPASAVPTSAPAVAPASGPTGFAGQYQSGQSGRASVPAVSGTVLPRQPVPNGVVRHTETVQVTTRHTVVDPRADDDSGGGTVYGGSRYSGRAGEAIDGEWSARPARGRRAAADEPWSERRAREPVEDRWSAGTDRDDSAEHRYGGRSDDRWDAGRGGDAAPAERWSATQGEDGYGSRGATRDDRYGGGRYAEDRYGDRPGRDGDDPGEGSGYRGGRFDVPLSGSDRGTDQPPWRDARWGQRAADAQADNAAQPRSALPALPAGSGAELAPWIPQSDATGPEPGRRGRRYRDEPAEPGRYRDDDGPGRRYRDEPAEPGRYRDGGSDTGRRYGDGAGRRFRDDERGGRYRDDGPSRYRDADEPGRYREDDRGGRYRDDDGPGRRYRDDDRGSRRYRDEESSWDGERWRSERRPDYEYSDDRRWR